MSEILFQYQEIDPRTWAYVSSLMIIGLFFKFSRFWSVRNLDLILLILLAPGLLLVHFGIETKKHAVQLVMSKSSEEFISDEVGNVSQELVDTIENTELLADLATRDLDVADADAETDQGSTPSTRIGLQIERGIDIERLGYLGIFVVGAILFVRLLSDPAMVRRPLLDPNLTLGGLTFVCCSLFAFLMANVITGEPTEDDLKGPRGAEMLIARQEAEAGDDSLVLHGPGLPLLHLLPAIATDLVQKGENTTTGEAKHSHYTLVAKIMAILSHLAVVMGIVAIGHRHFENIRTGMGAAVLYLLLSYTALMTGRVTHILPAALLIWAIAFYRRPEIAGGFLGLAMGAVYYPFFLLPLWISFYWQRGLMRFVTGVLISLTIVVLSLVLTSSDLPHFFEQLRHSFGLMIPRMEGLEGFWNCIDRAYRGYRIPVLVAAVLISAAFALWPAQKNLGTLLSCSTTVMLATQYWNGYGGGLYMAWYLPLLLLTIFRPNLEDRVAIAVLGKSWFRRAKAVEMGDTPT